MASTRTAAEARMNDVMRDFMARAVLFQDAVARFGGLNSTDLQCVSLLMSQGSATPGELAERSGLSAGGAITAVVDRLESAGYITRGRDPHDRRRVLVTADEQKVMATVGPIYGRIAARWGDYLQTLSDDQVEFAVELFTRAAAINAEEIDHLRASTPARTRRSATG